MFEELFDGAMLTFGLAILALSIGFCIALVFTYLLVSQKKIYSLPIHAFISFSRGVPLLVQIFLLYYGAAEFEWIQKSLFWSVLQHPFCCATIVLALNSSAYTTILLSNAVNSIPKGEIEVCQSLNFSFYQIMRHIIFPRVLSNVWPVYSNEGIMVLKSTSLVSTITLMDLMGAARQLISISYQTLEVLILASVIYLILAGILILMLGCLKKVATFIILE